MEKEASARAAWTRRASLPVLFVALVMLASLSSLSSSPHAEDPVAPPAHERVQFAAVPELPKAYLMTNAARIPFLQPLQTVRWLTSVESGQMRPDDMVLGLRSGGRAWAMPFWVIKNHHVANVEADGRPVLLTFCEQCAGGAAFTPVLDGTRHHFRVAGIYNGSHFISDDESGSYWLPFVGEAIRGPLKGARLERLPLSQCTWKEWLELYPDSFVVDGRGEPREGHGTHTRPGEAEGRTRRDMVRPYDNRLPPNELVLGVELSGRARAYPVAVLGRLGPVLNDSLGRDGEIVIVHKPGSLLTTALSRRLGRELLVFEGTTFGRMVDTRHRSTWSFDGTALGGPLAGKGLVPVAAWIEEWYSWAASHPETDIYAPSAPGQSR